MLKILRLVRGLFEFETSLQKFDFNKYSKSLFDIDPPKLYQIRKESLKLCDLRISPSNHMSYLKSLPPQPDLKKKRIFCLN